MKKDPKHILEIANAFKNYIPYISGNITHFYAPAHGKVRMNGKDSVLFFAGSEIYTFFPTVLKYRYKPLTNGFILKSNIKNGGIVQKDDLICIIVEPFDKIIQNKLSDYFKIDDKILGIKDQINSLIENSTTSWAYVYIELAKMFNKDKANLDKNIARLNNKIIEYKKHKAELYTNLMEYYKNEILPLRQYV